MSPSPMSVGGRLADRRRIYRLLATFLLATLLYILYTLCSSGLGGLYTLWGSAERWVIMIDAGSTGSRIHAISLTKVGPVEYKLNNDYYLAMEPGLSHYHTNPAKAAASLKPLLDFALTHIPPKEVENTLIQVKATAGLRLLSDQVAQDILNEVENFIKKSFKFKTSSGLASILDGQDEGIFAWTSLNYYLGTLTSHDIIPYAALDLGGGSFQIMLEVSDPQKLSASEREFVRTLNLGGKERHVYAKSYLGLGLKSMRKIVLGVNDVEQLEPADYVHRSSCLPKDYEGDWEESTGKTLRVGGSPDSGFESCRASLQKLLAGRIIHIDDLVKRRLYAFSYFFDKAKDSGLLTDDAGGHFVPRHFEDIAKEACQGQLLDARFQCLDLTYMVFLLSEAFQLPPDYTITVAKKISGEELTWALGATFHMLHSQAI